MTNIRKYWPGPNVGILAARWARLAVTGVFALLLSAAGALAATITVNTASDDIIPNDGSVSLREAITAMNAGANLGDPDIIAQNPGTFGVNDTINFSIPGTGVQIINVGTDSSATGIPLPTIVKPVSINGYSQAGSLKNTFAETDHDNAVLRIELNGAGAGLGANGLHLGLGSAGSTVEGLIVNHFSANGIDIESPGNTIAGNFIGTDPTGHNPGPGNANDGILINQAGGNFIGGNKLADRNIIAFNGVNGIEIKVLADVVQGNLIKSNGNPNGKDNGLEITGGIVDIK